MLLTNCEINLFLTWSANCVIINLTGAGISTIIDTTLYFPVKTLSTRDNTKLLQQMKSGFKRKTNWNKYQSKLSIQGQNQYLYFVDLYLLNQSKFSRNK